MSALRNRFDEYLRLRRALGFKLESAEPLLRDFVTYLEHHNAPTVTADLALAWAMQPPNGHPGWWAKKLGIVRVFAKHLQTLDAATEVPAVELLPHHSRRAVPYLYSDLDIARLMEAAQKLRSPLRAGTYATLIGLLAATGLRVGEAIGLDRQDVDGRHRVLTLRHSKFRKSREVPLHETTAVALHAYARMRDRLCPRPKAPSFFVSTAGTRLIYKNVQSTFHMLVRQAALEQRRAPCRPRLHDLRHSFAVRTLSCWYRDDIDVQARLPLLSTYLGHLGPTSTYWYLSAAPELLARACQRLEKAQEELT